MFESYQKSINNNFRNVSTNAPLPPPRKLKNTYPFFYKLEPVWSKFEFLFMRVSTETACSRFVGKTFFYFVSEAVKGENNTFNTKEVYKIDKNVQSAQNSCYEKTIKK